MRPLWSACAYFWSRNGFSSVLVCQQDDYFQYGYSNPVLVTDLSGRCAGGFVPCIDGSGISGLGVVRSNADLIRAVAKTHVAGATQPLAGFTADVLAALMGAIVGMESNIRNVMGERAIGNFVHNPIGGAIVLSCGYTLSFNPFTAPLARRFELLPRLSNVAGKNNPSTGIANSRIDEAIKLLNKGQPLYYTDFSMEAGEFDFNNGGHVDIVYKALQHNIAALDFLAAALLDNINILSAKGFTPTLFNVANLYYNRPSFEPSMDAIFEKPSIWDGHTEGARYLHVFDNAAAVLGLTVRLNNLPPGLKAFADTVHPFDLRRNPKEDRTEWAWADKYYHTWNIPLM